MEINTDNYFKELIDKHYIGKEDQYPIYDGPCRNYFESSLKILWILKEPYDEDDSTGGNWSLTWLMCEKPKDLVRGRAWPTWQPIVYVSYSILNGFPKYDDMSFIRDVPSMMEVLKEISYINLVKLPGGKRSSNEFLRSAYQLYRPAVLEQVSKLNPDVIICGGTFQFLKDDLIDVSNGEEVWLDGCQSFQTPSRIIINTYHPSYRKDINSRIDGIINSVKEWKAQVWANK